MGCRQLSDLGELRNSPFPLPPQKKTPKKGHYKDKVVGHLFFLTHCLSHLLFLVRLLAVWFAYKSAMMMLLIVSVRVQDSQCMGPGLVSWVFTIPASVRLLVVLLIDVWPVVSDMPIYDGFLDVYILYITSRVPGVAQERMTPTPLVRTYISPSQAWCDR
jgi:hypothetical protein